MTLSCRRLDWIPGRVTFSQLSISCDGKSDETIAQSAGAPTLNYGNFIAAAIQFALIVWTIFLLVKAINDVKREEVDKRSASPEPAQDEELLNEIRDLRKRQSN